MICIKIVITYLCAILSFSHHLTYSKIEAVEVKSCSYDLVVIPVGCCSLLLMIISVDVDSCMQLLNICVAALT